MSKFEMILFFLPVMFFAIEREPNVVHVDEPVVVVGDIHGQFYDLVQMIDNVGDPH